MQETNENKTKKTTSVNDKKNEAKSGDKSKSVGSRKSGSSVEINTPVEYVFEELKEDALADIETSEKKSESKASAKSDSSDNMNETKSRDAQKNASTANSKSACSSTSSAKSNDGASSAKSDKSEQSASSTAKSGSSIDTEKSAIGEKSASSEKAKTEEGVTKSVITGDSVGQTSAGSFYASSKSGSGFYADTKSGTSGSNNSKNAQTTGARSVNSGSKSGSTTKTKSSNENGKVVAWTLIVLTALILLIVMFSSSGSKVGIIKGLKAARYGEENVVTLNLNDYKYRKGDTITWKVDGEEVQKISADKKNAFNFDASTVAVGDHVVKAFIDGREIAKFELSVDRPLLKVEAQPAEVVYGDDIPKLNYKVSGFVDGDNETKLRLGNLVQCKAQKMDGVGQYDITLEMVESDKYEVEYTPSVLTVLPRELTYNGEMLQKEYDGTATLAVTNITLEGTFGSDVVTADAVANFSDKNVGSDKKISFSDVKLSGNNADNYVLKCASCSGTITPRTITLKEVVANDKIFDGTTNVTFAKVGSLDGVIESDSVEVGAITAAFSGSKPARNVKVDIYNVNLVGADSKNYSVKVECDVKADIVSLSQKNSVLNKIDDNSGFYKDRQNDVA